MSFKPFGYLGFCSLLALTACGSGDDDDKTISSSSSVTSSTSSTSTSSSSASHSSSSIALTDVSGLAAVGAAVSNATVMAICADGSNFTSVVTTNSQGFFSGKVTTGALPCALQLSGGSPAVVLHSYTATGGHVNITPLTDMIIANASNSLPADWFIQPDWNSIADYLAVATSEIETALADAGFILPAGNFVPFTQNFMIGDQWDLLLDNLQYAIDASASIDDYAALIGLVSTGSVGVLPSPPTGSSSSVSTSSSSISSASSSSLSSSSQPSNGASNSAKICYNPELTAKDTRVISNYQATDGASGEVIDFNYDQTIFGEKSFKGRNTRYAITDTIATGAAPSTNTTTAYFINDDSAYRSTSYGVEVVTTQPLASTTVISNQPGRLTRYDLEKDDSYAQTYTTSSQVMGFDINLEISVSTTFSGIETITVPAGTYEACRFIETENAVETSRWIAVEKGIELRVLSDGDDTVFVSGTVNGVAQ